MATIKLLVGSVFGGAERLADDVMAAIKCSNHQVVLVETPSIGDIKSASHLLIITSTTGKGDIPDSLSPLYADLDSQFPALAGKPYGVIALGDRNYGDTFCAAGRSFDELLRDLQAKPIGHRLEIDASEDFEPWPVTEPWLKRWLEKLPE